jgi:hypothetical protein
VNYDLDKVGEQMRDGLQPEGGTGYGSDAGYGSEPAPNATPGATPEAPAASGAAAPGATPEAPAASTEDDPMKAMQDALKPKQ